MAAMNKILAKRVDELTEALAEVRENAKNLGEANRLAEATAYANDIVDYIDEVIGPTEADEGSEGEAEEYEAELEDDSEEED
jgi:hypothetical protein